MFRSTVESQAAVSPSVELVSACKDVAAVSIHKAIGVYDDGVNVVKAGLYEVDETLKRHPAAFNSVFWGVSAAGVGYAGACLVKGTVGLAKKVYEQ